MEEGRKIDDIKKDLNEREATVQSFIKDVQQQNNEVQKITSIDEGMQQANKEYEAKRMESFKNSKGISMNEEIGEDLQEEFSKYELPKSERLALCRRAAEPLYNIYFARNRTLNALIGDREKIKEAEKNGETPQLGKLHDDAVVLKQEIENRDKRVKEIEKEIEKLEAEGYVGEADPENKDEKREFVKQAEIDALKNEMSGLNAEITEIKGYLARIEDLKQTAINAMGLQKEVRKNIENSLKGAYGEDVAQVVIDEQNKKEELEKNNSNSQEKGSQNADKTQQDSKNVQAAENPAVEEAAKEDAKPDYFGMLGFNPENVLNAKSSMALLDKYVGPEITDEQRLAMLNDPETRDVILNAMDKANGTLNPLNRIKFNKTRARLVQLAKNELVVKAIGSLGEKYPKDIEQSFKNAQNEYATLKKQIDEKMKGDISEEEKAKLQNELNELNKKYESINSVEAFRTKAHKLERFRDRAADTLASMLGKNDRLALPKENVEVKEQADTAGNSAVAKDENQQAKEDLSLYGVVELDALAENDIKKGLNQGNQTIEAQNINQNSPNYKDEI